MTGFLMRNQVLIILRFLCIGKYTFFLLFSWFYVFGFLTMICLYVDYLKNLSYLVFVEILQCADLTFSSNLERFQSLFLQLFFQPLSLFSSWDSYNVCAGRPGNVPLVSQLLYSFIIIIFLLLRLNHCNWLVFEFAESSANFSFQLLQLRNFYFLYIISIFY